MLFSMVKLWSRTYKYLFFFCSFKFLEPSSIFILFALCRTSSLWSEDILILFGFILVEPPNLERYSFFWLRANRVSRSSSWRDTHSFDFVSIEPLSPRSKEIFILQLRTVEPPSPQSKKILILLAPYRSSLWVFDSKEYSFSLSQTESRALGS